MSAAAWTTPTVEETPLTYYYQPSRRSRRVVEVDGDFSGGDGCSEIVALIRLVGGEAREVEVDNCYHSTFYFRVACSDALPPDVLTRALTAAFREAAGHLDRAYRI